MRLTDGEIPDSGERLRDEFLARLSKCAEVMTDLVRAVGLCRPGETKPNRALKTNLNALGKRWHLDANWLRESCFTTVQYYRETGALSYSPPSLALSQPSSLHLPPPEGFPVYFPMSMTRAEYIREVKLEVLKQLREIPILSPGIKTAASAAMPSIIERASEYCRQSEQKLKPKRRQRRLRIKNLERDIDWTVRYQVQRQSFREIALNDGASQDSVEKTVSRTLRELALVPRNPRGRQPGSANWPR